MSLSLSVYANLLLFMPELFPKYVKHAVHYKENYLTSVKLQSARYVCFLL